MTVTPCGIAMPVTLRPLARTNVVSSESGLRNGTAAESIGRSESPERRGRIASLPTKATSPSSPRRDRSSS